eukprot:scaffold34596_cov222-Amphora_coffeaeformis.AAC.6
MSCSKERFMRAIPHTIPSKTFLDSLPSCVRDREKKVIIRAQALSPTVNDHQTQPPLQSRQKPRHHGRMARSKRAANPSPQNFPASFPTYQPDGGRTTAEPRKPFVVKLTFRCLRSDRKYVVLQKASHIPSFSLRSLKTINQTNKPKKMAGTNGNGNGNGATIGTSRVKQGLAQMLKGGVIVVERRRNLASEGSAWVWVERWDERSSKPARKRLCRHRSGDLVVTGVGYLVNFGAWCCGVDPPLPGLSAGVKFRSLSDLLDLLG